MSSRFKEDEEVKCPWYKKETVIEIRCQGLCSGHCTQLFSTARQKTNYKYDFCNGNWKACEHSRALNDKFEYESKR